MKESLDKVNPLLLYDCEGEEKVCQLLGCRIHFNLITIKDELFL